MHKTMQYMLVAVMLSAVLTTFGASAWGNCACFCVEGQLKTLCTEVDDAQDNPNLCPAASSASCPQGFSTDGASSYDAPDERAENCRDAEVYDAISGEYVTAKVCNVI